MIGAATIAIFVILLVRIIYDNHTIKGCKKYIKEVLADASSHKILMYVEKDKVFSAEMKIRDLEKTSAYLRSVISSRLGDEFLPKENDGKF